MSILRQNIQTLSEIGKLDTDWNGYGAAPIPQAVLERSLFLLNSLETAGQPQHIYPTGRRTIQFEYDFSDRSYLEFEIYEDRITMLWVPRRKYNSAIQLEFSELSQVPILVRRFVGGKET